MGVEKTFNKLGVSKNKKKLLRIHKNIGLRLFLKELFEDEIHSSLLKIQIFLIKKILLNILSYKKGNFSSSFILMQILSSIKFMKLFNKNT